MSHRVPSWQPHAESIAVVVLLAAALLALFLNLPNPGVFDPSTLHRAGGMSAATALTEPWRLLACTWLHADWDHLISNLVMLLLMSVLLTRALGWDRFLLLYLGAGLMGSVVSAGLEQPDLSVGASGAIFGLTGATAAYAVHPRSVLHELEVLAVREALLPIVGMQLLLSFMPGISWGAHLGGFGFGFALAATGLLDRGLPERAGGLVVPPLRWSWVVGSTVGVMGIGCCVNSNITLALLGLYVLALLLTGRTGPDWRPDLQPAVMLSALAALGVNWLALGLALWLGNPWDLAQPEWQPGGEGPAPATMDVALPGGLGTIALPEGLAEERVDEEDGGVVVVQYGTRERYPFALRLAVRERQAPVDVVERMAIEPVEGATRSFTVASFSAEGCPWIGWETSRAAGMVVFTADAVVDVQLERWSDPADPGWAAAEDRLVRALHRLSDCGPSGWTAGEVGRAAALAGLHEQALPLIDRQLRATPNDHELRLVWAELALSMGRCQGALIEFERLAKSVPEEPRAWTGVAGALLSCGRAREDVQAAAEAADHALTLDPSHGPGWEASGEALVAMGEREPAAEAFEQAARLAVGAEEVARLTDRAEKARRGFRVRDRIGD